jgi:hypothetical protein
MLLPMLQDVAKRIREGKQPCQSASSCYSWSLLPASLANGTWTRSPTKEMKMKAMRCVCVRVCVCGAQHDACAENDETPVGWYDLNALLIPMYGLQAAGDLCSWSGRFRDIDTHLQSCLFAEGRRFALSKCAYCQERFKPRALVAHGQVPYPPT